MTEKAKKPWFPENWQVRVVDRNPSRAHSAFVGLYMSWFSLPQILWVVLLQPLGRVFAGAAKMLWITLIDGPAAGFAGRLDTVNCTQEETINLMVNGELRQLGDDNGN